MDKSMQLVYEIYDLCQKYNATIKACGDRILVDIPSDECILQVTAVGPEAIEWEDLLLRKEPLGADASFTYELTEKEVAILKTAGSLPRGKEPKCPN